ncbi:MAG: 4Fe-4S dicluster domain-containing protein [Polyangiaceae bacterium]|nr:4Fe-4S dicluster domain-containing protein [Polyangiaceae bacterium]
MGTPQILPNLRYQQNLDLGFGSEVVSRPGGEDLYRCIQCGTCSSTCPVSVYMQHTPRKIIAMTRAGFREDVLSSNTMWLCASCYSCTVECPKQIKITDIMYSLKRLAIREPRNARLPAPVLADEFMKSVAATGRSNETWTITWTWLRVRPLELLKQAWLGLRLWLKGRISIARHRMTGDRRSIRRLLKAAGTLAQDRGRG